jgi:hypothetical protein
MVQKRKARSVGWVGAEGVTRHLPHNRSCIPIQINKSWPVVV